MNKMIMIVPDELKSAINKKIDEAIAENPKAETAREYFFAELLKFYDEKGYIPEFKINKAEAPKC